LEGDKMANNLAKFQEMIGKDTQWSPSPVMRWLNPNLMSVDEMGLTFKYVVRGEMTNPFGTLHGGISAAIIDDAIGATMIAFNEGFVCITLNNTIDYLAPAKEGDTILARTTIIENENKISIVQCEIYNDDQSVLISKGISKLLKKTP
jgi:acyl-coenzyme A thioesterase 13